MPLRYFENIGDIASNVLTAGRRSITFGSHGNDTITSPANADELIMVGGAGDDTYVIGRGSYVTIADLNGGTDTIIAPSMTFANSVAALIDGRHLGGYDSTTDTFLLILDWLKPENNIEAVQFADITFSTQQLAQTLFQQPGFQGNFAWESGRLLPPGFGTADANEAILYYTQRNAEIHASQAAPANLHDSLVGGAANDELFGYEGNDTIFGEAGNDTINGNQGNDIISGGDGFDSLFGGKDADVINGNTGNDTVNGNIGNDTVRGGQGDDFINGGQDQDLLYGDVGNDTLSGDRGNDTLNGGAGADYFFFASSGSQDVIEDFTTGLDKIWLERGINGTGIVDTATALAAVSYSGGNAVLDLGGGNSVVLTGVQNTVLTMSDFVLL